MVRHAGVIRQQRAAMLSVGGEMGIGCGAAPAAIAAAGPTEGGHLNSGDGAADASVLPELLGRAALQARR